MSGPRAFISHSHGDAVVARELAEHLRARGVEAWLDYWEIKPGDSLIQKIFDEGLKECALFIILLSPDSVSSAWVKHELDVALVHRLSGTTRVVPVVAKPCDIPVALRPLLRLDLTSGGQDEAVSRLVDVAFGRDRKPPVGSPPSDLKLVVPGLDNNAARLALLLSGSMDQPDGRPIAFTGKEITEQLRLAPGQVNDAVEDLKALGLARTFDWIGTSPFEFGQVEPTALLAFQLKGTGALPYDAEEDVKHVAAAIAQLKEARGSQLEELTKLGPSRINRAVSYLQDYGIITVSTALGTAPYNFKAAEATSATRRFVAENSQS